MENKSRVTYLALSAVKFRRVTPIVRMDKRSIFLFQVLCHRVAPGFWQGISQRQGLPGAGLGGGGAMCYATGKRTLKHLALKMMDCTTGFFC